MTDTKNAFRAGIVIVIGTVIAIFFYFSSKKTALDDKNSIAYYALLTDAAGVNAKSLITVAGLQVGEIKNITLVPVPLGELVPDLEARALDALGFEPPSADIRIPVNEDFDDIVQSLISQGKLPSRDDVDQGRATRDQVIAAVARVKGDATRVARVDFAVSDEVKVPVDTWRSASI